MKKPGLFTVRMAGRVLKIKTGQITVFLSLIIILMFSLVFTLLESARSSGLKFRMELAANAGITSAFAMYDRTLWEEYGLLYFADMYGNGVEFEEVFNQFGQLNSGESSGPGTDWFRLDNFQVNKSRFSHATDNFGNAFICAVSTYMKEAGLEKEVLELYEGMDEADDKISSFSFLSEEGELNLREMKAKLNEVTESLENFEDNSEETKPIEVSGDPEKAGEIYSSLGDNLQSFIEKGFLSLVCDTEKITDSHFNSEDFPSKLDDYYRERTGDFESEAGLTDKVLFREYILSKLNNYTKDAEGTFELEYVLGGKDSNPENLSYVVKVLVGIRSALNYVFLKTHSRYTDEAYVVAALVAGWTGSSSIVRLAQELILLIWSVSEAVVDAKTLLSGKNVPLVKDTKDWRLSLEGAAKGADTEETGKDGLPYSGYLRLLLYIGDTQEYSYRTMDMIQKKVQETEPSFLMKNCIYKAKLWATSEAEGLFPFLPKELKYNLETEVEFGYES